MKVYEVKYSCPGIRCMDDIVICEKVEDIISIIAERHNENKENVRDLVFKEVSPETVRLRDLTVGDLFRLMAGRI